MTALLHTLLERAASRAPGRLALVDGARRVAYRDFAAAARRGAAVLRAHGLAAGDRVAVYLEKSCEESTAIFATSLAGGVIVPVNPLLRPRQVAHILADCGVHTLITTGRRHAELGGALDGLAALRRILLVDREASVADERLVPDAFAQPRAAAPAPPRHPHDLAAILYTSGSTGLPKGAMLSHAGLLAGSRIVCRYLGIRDSDRILSVLPFSFDYGLNQLLTAVEREATTVLLSFRFGNEIARAIHDQQATALAGVPGLWALLSDAAPAFRSQALPSLRYLTNSGGVVPLDTLARIRAAQPHADFILMYGFTEAFRSTYLPAAELDRRPTSIGKAIPETEVFLVDEHDRPCRPGEAGILVHDGPTIFLGYWGRAAETRAVLRPHPFRPAGAGHLVCYSGDRVRMDEDGFFYFVGRDDAMIKSAGYRISPTEVETVLLEAAAVREAAVIGLPHPVLGQAIRAFVAPRDPTAFDPDALLAFCAERMPRYMVPASVEVVEALPRTAHGKVDYPRLRERAA
ncbi:MAG: AMP-binding protein [Deltaproteobacteria bacterium]|nr:AMP-binding protein [Deltaproteobacteria bacterium]